MNQELENVNNRLVTRETLWSRTLEFPNPSPWVRIPGGPFSPPSTRSGGIRGPSEF